MSAVDGARPPFERSGSLGYSPSPVSSPAVIVFDSNLDALQRRVDLVRTFAPEAEVAGLASRNAVVLLAEQLPSESTVLVDLYASDRGALDRPGERLIRRLVQIAGGLRIVAWSAQPLPDAVSGARSAGAHAFVTAGRDLDQEREQLEQALNGASIWPADTAGGGEIEWQRWFASEYELAWEPWVEAVLVRLASGRERTAVAGELVARSAARSTPHAAARLRAVARAIAREHRNSPPVVADAATLALAQLAAHRPLVERPGRPTSLDQAARILRTSPSIVRASGLTVAELDEVLATAELIERERALSDSGAGAPPADQAWNERRWAAGRRALTLRTPNVPLDHVIEALLAQLDEAIAALEDARQDALYHPEAQAAAALSVLAADPQAAVGAVPEVALVEGELRWRGVAAAELAAANAIPVDALQTFTAAADAFASRSAGR